MNEKDLRKGKVPEIVIWERRAQNRAELSSAEVMKILRERAARAGKRCRSEAQWSADVDVTGEGAGSRN